VIVQDALVVLNRHAVLRDPTAAAESILSEEGALLLVNKPYADTSFYIVNKIRKAMSNATGLRRIKCGHAGTLDPLATGLLILATRRKTRQLTQLIGLEKTYLLRMRFGVTSPSFDLERPIELVDGADELTPERVSAAIASLPGSHKQMPPIFSAIKQKGRPVYLKARAGKEVTMVERDVVIHSTELIEMNLPEVTFRVRVSKGTYVRSLVRDLAVSLGTGGILVDLVREAIGPWRFEDALTPNEAVDLLSKISIDSTTIHAATL
jgi:tRNA pseudouridine55 synthase